MTTICRPLAIFLGALALASNAQPKPPTSGPVTLPNTDALYQQLFRANIDGIGKFFMGRQISHVMGHQGAEWLERPEREREENTTELIKCLKLKSGDQVLI